MRKWTKNKIKYIVQNRQNADCKASKIEKQICNIYKLENGIENVHKKRKEFMGKL